MGTVDLAHGVWVALTEACAEVPILHGSDAISNLG